MRKTLRVLKATCVMAVLPGFATAQSLGDICSSVGRLAPGQWVEYTISGTESMGAMAPSGLWVGNVGTEQRDGVGHTLYESRLMGAQNLVSQLLITGDGGPWDMDNLVEMRMQMPGQAPMTISGAMLDMARQQSPTPDIAEQCARAEVLGHESVSVPFGTFQAIHLKVDQNVEVWASADVPMAALKVITPDGPTMELKAHGDGATSSIN